MFKKILFPIDFSETSLRTLGYVLEIANKFDSEIYLLYITRDLTYFTELDVPHPSIYSFNQDIKKGAEKKMRDFCEVNLLNKAATCKTMVGEPASEIVNFIKENGINLVVMGTHGRQGLSRVVFGSVAARVIRTSPVPVMTIRPNMKN